MVVMMARTLDIKGYVQNLPNGKVFIIAEGPGEDLARFVKSVRIDNTRIVVEEIFIDCRDAKGEFKNFYKMDSKQVRAAQTGTASQSQKGQLWTAEGRCLLASSGLEKIGFETERIKYKLEKIIKDREDLLQEMESSCDLFIDGLAEQENNRIKGSPRDKGILKDQLYLFPDQKGKTDVNDNGRR